MKIIKSVRYKHIPLFRKVTSEEWNDWRWQMRNAVHSIDDLKRVVKLKKSEVKDLENCLKRFRMAITPYYAALMDREYRLCSVRLQAVPTLHELQDDIDDWDDPLAEDVDSPVPGITHRYPDRALFMVTNICSMYCRHCTRRRMVGSRDSHLSRADIQKGINYIKAHPEIRDVILSGGDPLMLTNTMLEDILKKLRQIPHVEIIRIGSRMPVVLPQRITDDLVTMLKQYHPLYVNTHFNHYKEITKESKEACERLVNAGIPVHNQSVLLRDVNDCPRIMKKLMQTLLMIRVRPYYIYQCDMSRGIAHFRTSITKGIEIMENLRGHTSGLALPTFVVDAPGGGGKIPVGPDYILSRSDKRVILRNYEGVITTYSEPENIYSNCWCELCKGKKYGPEDGLAKLLLGEKTVLEPEGLKRKTRHKKKRK
ncbi:MAG: lysine 2,3-aminomutase [Fibrobacteria bacterium]|nr:lysine 2,3-aminomutase [Fibrobacteria bacterium]